MFWLIRAVGTSKGVVEVCVDGGPTLSLRITPEDAEALQAHVDQAAGRQ